MVNKRVATYLNDHLAGAVAACDFWSRWRSFMTSSGRDCRLCARISKQTGWISRR